MQKRKLAVHDIPALACVGVTVILFLLQAWACGGIAAGLVAFTLYWTNWRQ